MKIPLYSFSFQNIVAIPWRDKLESGHCILMRKPVISIATFFDRQACMSTESTPPLHIRWMIRRDMPEVLEIEKWSFEFPWSEQEFISCLRQRNAIGMVAEHDEQIIGFMIYELNKNQLNLFKFAVKREFRRRGAGRAMAQKLIGKLSPQRRNTVEIILRETNLAAQIFFKAMGFRATAVLPDHFDNQDAGFKFRYRLEQPLKSGAETMQPSDSQSIPPLSVYLEPGDASPQLIAEFFVALDVVYRAYGGSGLKIETDEIGALGTVEARL